MAWSFVPFPEQKTATLATSVVEDRPEAPDNFFFGNEPDYFVHRLPTLKKDECRDAHDLEIGGLLGILVYVDLIKIELTLLLPRHLLDNRGEHLARTAPSGPEIDERRFIGFEDLGIKGLIGNFPDGCAHFKTSM